MNGRVELQNFTVMVSRIGSVQRLLESLRFSRPVRRAA
jgi:hypothetical protein